jgi:Suppressor of fused protein (SUFU).
VPVPVLEAVEEALVASFGQRPKRASVSFVGVDPIEVLRFAPDADERAYITLGMARYPMTGAEQSVVTPDGPRAELLLRLRDPNDECADVWRRLAVLAAAPAVEGVVYAAGMSVDLGEPLAPGSACTGVLVRPAALASIEVSDGAVEVLEVVPATATELAWCRVRGTAALEHRWAQVGTDLLDVTRRSAPLG